MPASGAFPGPVGPRKKSSIMSRGYSIELSRIQADRACWQHQLSQCSANATQRSLFELLEHNQIPISFNKTENCLRNARHGDPPSYFEVSKLPQGSAWWSTLHGSGSMNSRIVTKKLGFVLRVDCEIPKRNAYLDLQCGTPKGFDWVYHRFIANTTRRLPQLTLAQPGENRHPSRCRSRFP
jgi:hypothetical protein